MVLQNKTTYYFFHIILTWFMRFAYQIKLASPSCLLKPESSNKKSSLYLIDSIRLFSSLVLLFEYEYVGARSSIIVMTLL